MEYNSASPGEFGRSLTGMGLNLLVRDVRLSADFLQTVFDMRVERVSDDFAILTYHGQPLQLHRDATFAAHPLHALLPESGPRGAGSEFRLYQSDPDDAAARAESAGGLILQVPSNKPHGLREAVILDPDGYAWVPSRHLTASEEAALS